MKISLLDVRHIVRDTISENEKKPADPRKKIGKVVKYFDREFRVRDVMTRPASWGDGHLETFYVGTFEDEENGPTYHAPADKISKGPSMRAKKPEDFDAREFVEQDIEHFLKALGGDGRANIFQVRDRWAEISASLSWMEKYIFDSKWLNTPMAKSNEELAVEMDCKLGIVRATETRAFHKIEKFITGDGDVFHDIQIIKQARAMHKAEQPLAKIRVFLNSELKNKDWIQELEFLK